MRILKPGGVGDMQAKSRWSARSGLLALLLGLGSMLLGVPAAEAASMLVISSPQAGHTTGKLPKFNGQAAVCSGGTVKVVIHTGASATGSEAASAEGPCEGSSWAASSTKALAEGEYTAVAQQPVLGGLLGEEESEPVSFLVNPNPPSVTLDAPESARSNNEHPSFKGTASEAGTVTVTVSEHGTAKGTVTAEAPAGGGEWSTPALPETLTDGEYTAMASEPSSLGNGPGASKEISFTVDTQPPEVSIAQLKRSNETTPTFTGTASESKPVTVSIHEGPITGPVVESVESLAPSGGKWSAGPAGTLLSGTYTAVAAEPSSIGNKEGEASMTFVVDTAPPAVAIVQLERSNETTPTFTGTASESEPVTVTIHEGSSTGKVAQTLKPATPSGGKWSAGPAAALPSGSYTAVAAEPSSISNGEGEASMTFVIDTEPPEVSILQLSRSKETKPSFSGTASESEPVMVTIHEGSSTGKVLQTLKPVAPSGGKWSAGPAAALPSGGYTAVAVEPSSIGNKAGETSMTFVIDTEPPEVKLTSTPEARSKNTKPSFGGTASETEPVIVTVYRGPEAKGTEAASAEAMVKSGKWSTGPLTSGLTTGQYTAIAREESSLGNAKGQSAPFTFVVDTENPKVTITQLQRSNNVKPSFSGTTDESKPVTLKVYEGTVVSSEQFIEEVAGSVNKSGEWTAGPVSEALQDGTYTAVASEESSIGNGTGESSPMIFTIDTAAPSVKFLSTPPPRSHVAKPSFTGEAGETKPVKVKIYPQGNVKSGSVVEEASSSVQSRKWSLTMPEALVEGKYTAIAYEESSIGNGIGESEPASFEVHLKAPVVKITSAPAARSKVTTPTFAGEASETEPVSVEILNGKGEQVEVVGPVAVSGGKWSTGPAGALTEGKYTAVAMQESSIGDGIGKSEPASFEVHLKAPVVKITSAPAARSKVTTPTFAGEASETEPVSVEILNGKGEQVEVVGPVAVSGGKWSTGPAGALTEGKYTAVAMQESSIGDGIGKSEPASFEVHLKAPVVKITSAPAARSKVTTPTFAGEASETEPVSVEILNGKGEQVEVVGPVAVSGGKWSTGPAGALTEGKYTAVAMQESSIGDGIGKSEPASFEVHLKAPVVKITSAPAARSKVTTPTFAGEASETEPVSVEILNGKGEQVEVVGPVAVSGGKWSTGPAGALTEGKYTAVAMQESSIGDGIGKSEPASFEVHLKTPVVKITSAPAARSKVTTPTFAGEASETEPVSVEILNGKGEQVEVVGPVAVSGGKWSTGPAGALTEGKYTAVAMQESSIGDGIGKSEPASFEVHLKTPVVKITSAPAARSKVTTPTFAGEASETEPVSVEILNGKGEQVEVVGPVAVSGGKWSTGPAGALTEGKYTAVAMQESSIGDGIGKSEPASFEVHLKTPVVKITSAPAARSKVTTPTFAGEASETEPVSVEILNGKGEQVEVVGPVAVSGGKWSTGPAGALTEGKYTAVAMQESSIGDGIGKSEPAVSFEVHLKPPVVSVNAIPRSKNTKPAFSGTASETNSVTVKVYNELDELVRTLTASVENGTWSTQPLSQALSDGQYTVIASQESSIADGIGESEPRPFSISTRPPGVNFTTTPPTRSKNTKPTFAGEASETNPVTVKIYKGTSETELVQTSSPAPVSGRDWTVTLSTALAEGTYTAVAYEESSIGNGVGHSEAASFEVHVKPPVVKFTSSPPARSKDAMPVFEGDASETEPVTVKIFNNAHAVVASVTSGAIGTGGKWLTPPLEPALAEGAYTAVAYEESSIEDGPGESEVVSFEVHLKPPAVTIGALPHSNNKTPSFSGEASETKPVTVKIYKGNTKTGTPVESITSGSVSGGKWSTAAAPKALEEGEYTAVAYEESSIEDGTGESEPLTFFTRLKPPVVKFTSVPAARSKLATPSFAGTASETNPVTVKIFKGTVATGTPVATLTSGAVSSEKWATKAVSPALEEGVYTAVAYQESSIEDGTGESEAAHFEVHLKPPVVTLVAIARSNTTMPTFSGTATETKPVTVKIYKGATKDGTFVESVASGAVSGNWSAGPAAALAEGEYTAVAYQESSIEDGTGESESRTFEISGKPPTVTLNAPAERSPEPPPSFSGSASEAGTVTVHVFEGTKAEGTPVVQLQATVNGKGEWTTGPVVASLEGTYTAKASEPSGINNGTGESEPHTFEVTPESPIVTLEPLETPSKDLTPSFSGETDENTPIVVEVFEGNEASGTLVATVTGKALTGGCSKKTLCKWTSGALSPALETGLHTYTAVAKQESALGNKPGKSRPVEFVVDTEPPTVTLNQPRPLTNDKTPAFSGTSSPSSETQPVVVSVYKGQKPEGTPVAKAEATPSGGRWVTKPLSVALESGEYTVAASQKSSLGNPEGHSKPASFVLDRNPSEVTVKPLPSPSADVTPSFSGTASAATTVTVHIYSGDSESGSEVQSVESGEVQEGKWATAPLTEALEDGEYTAVATQPAPPALSGNPEGKSAEIHFVVVSREPTVANVTSSVVEGGNSAYMNATVNPNGGSLDYCRVEYGLTAAYGKSVDCAFEVGGTECAFVYPPKTPSCAFPPEKETAIYARVNGLAFGKSYFFRVVVENAGNKGTKAAGEGTFTIEALTNTGPPDGPHTPVQKAPPPAGLTTAEVEAAIVKQLAPSGNAATIAKLLKKGAFSSTFQVPLAGTAVIGWYYLPKGATLAGRSSKSSKASKAHKPVLVATGKVSVSSPQTVTVKMKLTASGKRLLRTLKKVRLTAMCVFTPSGKSAITTYKTFELTRR